MTHRIALLGFWHVHAKDFLREATAHSAVQLSAGWDPDPSRGEPACAAAGIPFLPSLDGILADPSIDGVIICTATRDHTTVIPRALQAGKHVLTEKVLAPSAAEAEELVALANASGRILKVALQRRTFGTTHAIRDLVRSGAIGIPTHARVRVAHDGAVRTDANPDGWLPDRFFHRSESCGGALIDLGAHPLYLLAEFLGGMPAAGQGILADVTDRGVDDHAVAVFRWPSGAIGVAETGFVSLGPFTEIEVNGTEGNIHLSPIDGVLRLRQRGGAWTAVQVPPDDPVPFAQWLSAISGVDPDPENLEAAIRLSAMIEMVGGSRC